MHRTTEVGTPQRKQLKVQRRQRKVSNWTVPGSLVRVDAEVLRHAKSLSSVSRNGNISVHMVASTSREIYSNSKAYFLGSTACMTLRATHRTQLASSRIRLFGVQYLSSVTLEFHQPTLIQCIRMFVLPRASRQYCTLYPPLPC